jgi:putative flavoprotein involved in K+ transport
MRESIETVIIGGGQAGLAASYYLKQHKRENVILEQAAQPANAWRNDRWDSFTLLTPNWSFQLPGADYDGADPDGFMPKDEIVQRFENYVKTANLPIRYQAHVNTVKRDAIMGNYLVKTDEYEIEARNVIIATGLFQKHKIPSFSKSISPSLFQLAAGQYRNPDSLPKGAVLVVGSAQSGAQIAEELYKSGRRVYLCLGSAGRVPRRYRGKDIYRWMQMIGWLDRTPDQLPSPRAKFIGNPHVTGNDGGRTLNLHQFAHDGVILLGHLIGGYGNQIGVKPDFKENLAKTDKVEADLIQKIDTYIERTSTPAPIDELPHLQDGFEREETTDLHLLSAGITSIIWAMGYTFDFRLVKLPLFDTDNFPIQERGITPYPGLYFLGLPWLHKFQSGHLVGVAEDAAYVVSRIVGTSEAPR